MILSAVNLADNISVRSLKVTIVSEDKIDLLCDLSILPDDWVNYLNI